MPLTACHPSFGQRGFTLAEMLVVVLIVAVIASIALPTMQPVLTQQGALVASEAANVLRFAVGESRRTGRFILVDGRTQPGHLRLYYSNASADVPPTAGTAEVIDPLTKRALDFEPTLGGLANGTTLTVQFRAASAPRTQLLIYPNAAALHAFDGAGSDLGALESGSGLVLTGPAGTQAVGIHEITALVTLP
ncbi:MAG: prepilin-type N-terminal cleavage/methylation domain-containing protein [Azonexus sp.]|nr:prepilin-type N-terminal cleavage/methylation domain-containing protein [Azonexus sp.]